MSTELKARLGLFTTVTIVIGSVIGSGVFKKAASMTTALGSPELVLLVLALAGVITLFGALTNAEVASMIPSTGGQYKFFQRMYGNVTAYLYGWAIFSVIQTGSIASITYIFSEYFSTIVSLPHFSPEIEQAYSFSLPFLGTIAPLANAGVKALTIAVITVLTYINIRGVESGGFVSVVFTTLKVGAILAIVLLSFTMSGGSFANVSTTTLAVPQGMNLVLAIVTALSAAFWAYDGWNSITYIAGEIRDAQRTIPLALLWGMVIVMVVYVLINLAYFYVLPAHQIAGAKVVAQDVVMSFLGAAGASLIAAAVMISTIGASNNTTLNSARAYFAMAQDGLFFSSLAKVHPRYQTPSTALWWQCLWSSALVLTGTFDTLTDMLIFVSWIFYGLSAYGVFVLRKKEPNTERPYKVWGYPFVPAAFVVCSIFFVGFTLYKDILAYQANPSVGIQSLFGLIIVALGAPLYFWFNKKRA